MISLSDAIHAGEKRKTAAFAHHLPDGGGGIVFSDSEVSDRAIFGGFDVDYEELKSTSITAGQYFASHAGGIGLIPLFTSAWIEGLLVGLLASQQLRKDDDAPVG